MKSLKKAGKQVGQSVSNAAEATNLEATYITRKNRNDFPHKGEIAEDVKLLEKYTKQSLKPKLDSLISLHANVADQEPKVGEAFKKAELGEANASMDRFGIAQEELGAAHKDFVAVLKGIKEEWGVVEREQSKAQGLHEKLNRYLHDKKFYKEKKNEKEHGEAKAKYNETAAEFHTEVTQLVSNFDIKMNGWMDAIHRAEVDYYSKALAAVNK